MNKILIVLSLLVGFTLNAYSQEPFQCDNRFYLIFGDNGETVAFDVRNNSSEIAPNNAGERVNSVGFRVSDNFAYGVFVARNNLARISSDGTVDDLGPIDGLNVGFNFPAGDFGPDGLLYINGNMDDFFAIDIDEVEVVDNFIFPAPKFSISDMAYNPIDGLFYGVTTPNSVDVAPQTLIALDLDARTVDVIGPTNTPDDGVFASMFADGTGNVYGANRLTDVFYQFDTETGEGTALGEIDAPGPAGADGYFCRDNPGPFPVRNIPTLSEWGLIAMAGVMGVVGFLVLRRRKVAA